jgi:hypothetical protein
MAIAFDGMPREGLISWLVDDKGFPKDDYPTPKELVQFLCGILVDEFKDTDVLPAASEFLEEYMKSQDILSFYESQLNAQTQEES